MISANARCLLTFTLLVQSTAFTFQPSVTPSLTRQPLRAESGEEIRGIRSKSFSPIDNVSSRPDLQDNRYSNNVGSHLSTLYDQGEVVQDFRAGSVAKNAVGSANSSTDTRYSYSTASSYGQTTGMNIAPSPSQGQAVQDFQLGSASKHTAPAVPASNNSLYGDSYSAGRGYSTQSYSQAGQVVQDFRVGSASKHTVANNSAASSLGTSVGSALFTNSIANYPGGKHYQLEEMEDSETCTTDIFLNNDSTVLIGETNGPLFISGGGFWSTDSAADGKTFFEMELNRRYQTGKEASQKTDIGEFDYDVKRTFRGELILVGGTVLAMNGEILDVDDVFGDRRVGFFNMIDTTEARKQDSVE